MIKLVLKLVLSSFLVLSFVACNKTVPLRNPSFDVQAKSATQVQTAIKKALQSRRWAITSESAGVINAKYSRGSKYHANVKIAYNKSNVTVTLVASENLNQENTPEGEVIHKTYDGLIRNLENDIYIELSHL